MDRGKARRVTRKVAWVRDELKRVGCQTCGFNEGAAALRFAGARRNPLTLAYDDLGWQQIRNNAEKSYVICLNCEAIAQMELRQARVMAGA